VISTRDPLLLDMGVVVLLCRGGDMGQRLDARYGISSRREVPLLSVISVGELLAFARNASWGGRKEARLHEVLANLVIVDIQARAGPERLRGPECPPQGRRQTDRPERSLDRRVRTRHRQPCC
jgi:hypothetical protein